MLEAAAKETIDRTSSIPESPKHPTIRLSKDPRMGFVDGHNVNYKQRDQYVCDEVNVRTGENTTGTLTMIQGQKGPKNKYKRVLPRFSVCLLETYIKIYECCLIFFCGRFGMMVLKAQLIMFGLCLFSLYWTCMNQEDARSTIIHNELL